MNRRLAAHRSHQEASASEPVARLTEQGGASSRAALAAARVAARYAKAPSYSEMLAEEARTAVRAAEAASKAALEAQAAAESVLAGLEAGLDSDLEAALKHPWEHETFRGGASEHAQELAWKSNQKPAQAAALGANRTLNEQTYEIRWDEDLPVRPAEPAAGQAPHRAGVLEISVEDGWEPGSPAEDALGGDGIEVVEPVQSIHANLIEFPRELVATRKVRPRLTEGPLAAETLTGQLSIFEVDPGSISTDPETTDAVSQVAPAWQGPEWSGIELDAEPVEEPGVEAPMIPAVPTLQQAPLGLRLMAALVDGALIMGAFLVAAVVAAEHMKVLPSIKEIELGSALALAALGVVYHALFFTLAEGTPGMKYARISLCTFDDEMPTRAQMRSRLWALLLSLLPVGLGVAWALFDEDRLSWHDRLSRTYLRRC